LDSIEPLFPNREEILKKRENQQIGTFEGKSMFSKGNFDILYEENRYLLMKSFDYKRNKRKIREIAILEAEILQILDNFDKNNEEKPIFLKFQGLFKKNDDFLLLVTETGPFTMKDILKAGKIYKIEEIAYFLKEISQILEFLEKKGIAIRGIKAKSVIFFENKSKKDDFLYKIADFSNSCVLRENEKLMHKETIGTMLKIPGNIGDFYNIFKVDVYLLGLLTLKMMGFLGKSISSEEIAISNENQRKILLFLSEMISEDPNKRPNFMEIRLFLDNCQVKKPEDEYKYYKIIRNQRFEDEDFEKSMELFRLFEKDRFRIKEAKFHLKKAYKKLENQPKNSDFLAIYWTFGQIYRNLNKFQKSRLFLEKSLAFSLENNLEITKSYDLLSDFLFSLGYYKESEAFSLKSIEFIEKNNDSLENLITPYTNLANIYKTLDKLQESEAFYLKSHEIIEKTANNEELLAISLNNLGLFYRKSRDIEKSLDFSLKSLRIIEKTNKNPAILIKVLTNLGFLYIKNRDFQLAQFYLLKSREKGLEVYGENSLEVANSLINLGFFYEKHNNFIEAEKNYLDSLLILENFYTNSLEIIKIYEKIGILHKKCHRFMLSKYFHEKSLDKNLMFFGENHAFSAISMNNLACLLVKIDEFDKAEELYFKALAYRQSEYGIKSIRNANILNNIARLYEEKNDFKNSQDFYLKSLEIYQENYHENHRKTVKSLLNLGILHREKGNLRKSEDFLLKALNIMTLEKTNVRNIKKKIRIIEEIIALYEKLGWISKAFDIYQQEIAVFEEFYGQNSHEIAILFNNIAVFASKIKKIAESEAFFLKSIDIFIKIYGLNDANTATSMHNLAKFYQNTSNLAKSLDFYNKSLGILITLYDDFHENIGNIHSEMARLYLKTGKPEKAEISLEKAINVLKIVYRNEENVHLKEMRLFQEEIQRERQKTTFDKLKTSFNKFL